jgi:hypothetical protein
VATTRPSKPNADSASIEAITRKPAWSFDIGATSARISAACDIRNCKAATAPTNRRRASLRQTRQLLAKQKQIADQSGVIEGQFEEIEVSDDEEK